MKKLLSFMLSILLVLTLSAPYSFAKGGKNNHTGSKSGSYTKSSAGSTRVRGYTKKDGTYVAPHHRTKPDKSKTNNWSSKGNVNPYTGKKGSKNPDK